MANLPIERLKSLYYQKGYSAREVGEELGVSMDVVYKFMRKHDLRRRDLYEMNKVLFARKPLSFTIKEILTAEEEKLKIAGIMLYWAEGAKASSKCKRIDFANSDVAMIELFLCFLRTICGVDEKRLRILIYCYANQDLENIEQYWSNVTDIPLSQFTKPYVRKDYSMKNGREMKYGLAHVRYSDKKLLGLMQNWTDDYVHEVI
ncbi:MAG: hypothetical protein ABII72_00705 [Parcubacteria group bacterium]